MSGKASLLSLVHGAQAVIRKSVCQHQHAFKVCNQNCYIFISSGVLIQIRNTLFLYTGPSGHKYWECNLAAVWGQMSVGGGHSTLQESLAPP